MAGWVIIAAFFGLLGTWSFLAPLNGAIVANGFIKVETNRKSIQHLDGGIVRELRVREGDEVKKGQVLIVLDDTQARAERDVLREQYFALRAADARLQAEFAHAATLTFSADLASRHENAGEDLLLSGQQEQFKARADALEGQHRIIVEKIAQLEAQIEGSQAQMSAHRDQLESVKQEITTLAPLVDRGVISRPRLLQLQRTSASLEGQVGEFTSAIARARQAIAEQKQLSIQLEKDRSADVTRELRDNRAKLAEVMPRLMNADAALGRMEIRAPYEGRVIGLTVFSTGAVIGRGEKIMDIVPDHEALVVETQIGVEDIADLRAGMKAEIRLTAYRQRTTPVVYGEVAQVSADRLVDNRSGSPYYLATVRINDGELEQLPDIHLHPGMPTSVMIQTVERTAFDYLVGPLVSSFDRAFRQK
jgi:HlyD family type I secretion membrane fusion protein